MQLNVYSEGDFFKAHLDTPRTEQCIGSLVFCLASAHEGGCLIVRHAGQEVSPHLSAGSAVLHSTCRCWIISSHG